MLRKRQILPIASLACFTALALWACTPTPPTQAVSNNLPSQKAGAKRTPPPLPGQVLPVAATVKLGDRTFELEIATTRSQQSLGLMFRTFLPNNRGMVFPFSPPQPVQFWMKNCRISLDMIFVRQGKVIAILPNTPPCTTDPCPIYGPNEPVDRVIEIRGNQAATVGLKVGDSVEIRPLKTP
jgi:uncharacterized membrane protein (UPF0127 family)